MKRTVLLLVSIFLVTNILFAQEAEKKELKPALLVIDVQNAFVPMMDQSDKDRAFQMINGAIWVFENFKLPIIRIYHQDEQWGPATDSEGFKFDPAINVTDDQPMIIKHYGDGFNKTDLDKILKEKGINTVFLCGLSATGCVLATFIGASNHDYKAFMVKDALLSPNANQTNTIEEIMNTVDLETMMFMFEYMK
ncbi:MAG TPA: isochorismatase family cysteine hydrolase [Bacteroidales bacterium]|nr:isochorismatase family cysteine hydrolase [Bacteroidales bacterium]